MGMRPRLGREAVAFLTVTLSALAAASTQGYAQAAFVAPPRTITDITAILDQQKPNPDTARKLRAEALRQAILALMNGPGFTDGSRRTLFTYAHPLFWAPYSIIGDGQ
jgi:hypothetical protein